MEEFDVVLLTEKKYVNPKEIDCYIQNILTEDNLVQKALEAKGLKVIRVDWADLNFDWKSTQYTIFRTTWDYSYRFKEFSKWLNTTASITKHLNTIEQIFWNMDKHYLIDLQKKNVNITTTFFIEPKEKITLKELHQNNNWTETVLKPTISGAARHTYKLNSNNLDQHEEIFQELINNEAMMLQPFQYNIVNKGEISLMVFGGKYTHAVLKVAKKGDFRVQDDFGGKVFEYNPSKQEIAFAEFVVAQCEPLPVYARVDIFIDNDNQLAVSELELIEPELWFRFNPKTANIFADVIYEIIRK